MPENVALVDLGSNAVRMLLVRIHPGKKFRILHEERVQARLGSGRAGRLPPSGVKMALRATHRFLGKVQKYHPRVIAVATSAVRDADNRASLLQPLKSQEGIEVEILSGAEEARLGALAVLHTQPFRQGLITDLGGGSLQLTRIRKGDIVSVASFPLGTVRVTRRFLKHDPPTPQEIRALRDEIRTELAEVIPVIRKDTPLIGLGGTTRALARLHIKHASNRRLLRKNLHLKRSEIASFLEKLAPIPVRKRRLPGLRANRADIIVAGIVIIEEVMTLSGYSTLTIFPQGGVRNGVLVRETFNGGI